jgi:DNA-binding SARP family transcriptional activator/predicted ATPase
VAGLSVRLLGPFQITLDEEPATGFVSDKVRALLAYLAVENEQPHRREKLAGLLWPDWTEGSARANLRRALANLRQVIGDHEATPPYLHISRQAVQFNTGSDAWVDVAAFTNLSQAQAPSPEMIEQLEQAVELCRGDFLEGFSIGDSAAFEEWALLHRERLLRMVMEALHRLAAALEQMDEYEPALERAWRQVELDPWRETAHRQVMRLLALSGQRSAALAQYETCRQLLAEGLGVEPAAETTELCEQIRSGTLKAPMPHPPALSTRAVSLPAFLDEEAPRVELPSFVARKGELAQLARFLALALAGQGRVAFVTGEAGSGKTALVQEFARRAQEAHADPSSAGKALIAASGNCNAYTGIGDPYLPWREILGLLTGDVQSRWAAGAMTKEHARRLWDTLPLTAQALVEAGPDLVGTLIPPGPLLERALAATQRASSQANWLPRLRALGKGQVVRPVTASLKQSDLFEQYTRVLQALARQVPLVLIVDDLQWADVGSISLLFHLGRQLAGSRILLVGTYRPEEVALGRDGGRHPLEGVVHELHRLFGDVAVNVDQAERRDFVEAILDSEPNRLGVPFRQMLYQQARGHPLSTIELLRGMQDRGDLVQDQEGHWVEGPALDWETLPARVEAAIAERIGRLAEPLRAALRVASVEGEDFTAEVVARVLETDRRKMVRRLSNELDRRHRLVRAQQIDRFGSRRVSRYRFRHYLFQKYLYDTLDKVERAYLHEDVGNALEELYGVQTGERAATAATSGVTHVAATAATAATAAVAVQLAWHFQEAGIPEKAIHYLHQAGERAVQLSAHQEGIAHLTRALELLMALPEPGDASGRPERTEQELALQLSLGRAYMIVDRTLTGMIKAYSRARELCQQMGRTSDLCGILGQLATPHYVRAELRRARALAEEAFSLAQQTGDPLLVALGHWRLAYVLFALGEFTEARAHLEPMIAFYEPQHHSRLVLLSGSDAGLSALAYDACCLWYLGYPEQALQKSEEAFVLARAINHPFSLAEIVLFAGCLLNSLRRDAKIVKDNAEELVQLASEKLMPTWLGMGVRYRGEALAMLGQVQEGMAQMREGIAIEHSTGCGLHLPRTLGALAEAQARAGNAEEGLATLAEALDLVEQTDERCWEAELHRLRGELLLAQGQEAGAEASLHHAERCFQHAIEVARRQQAKSWELRATTSLARLWQAQGRADEAQEALAGIYGWFTEGFGTPDLREARALLETLR